MPPSLPPAELPGTPTRHVLPAGTSLWRVHRSGRPANQFDGPRLSSQFGGNRFDSVGGAGYPYFYCSPDTGTALAERFVRDLDFSATATRILPRRTLRSQTASVVRTTRELTLLRLMTAPDLAAVGQDTWLLSAQGTEFDLTRRWAAWLRDNARWAQGFVWQSSVDMPKPTMVLFGDACDADDLRVDHGMAERLDETDRESWLAHHLAPYRVRLHPAAPLAKPKIFVNYRSDNGGQAANALDRELTRRLGEAAVFLDRRSIAPATEFPPEILDKVRGCAVLVVVAGPGWEHTQLPNGNRRLTDEHDWVRREIREAAGYQVPVMPVLVGARPRLAADDLPADIRFLADLQYMHLPDGFDTEDVALLVDRMLERFRGLVA